MALRTSNLWKMQKLSEQWPFGLTIRRTNESWDHWTNFRTNEPSDNKPFGPMTVRTIGHSDLWNDFRTNDPSDYRPVGLLTIRTSARFSDQWTFGPTTIRNIELSPLRLRMSVKFTRVTRVLLPSKPYFSRQMEEYSCRPTLPLVLGFG